MTALKAALDLLARGFWPVPLYGINSDGPSPGKRPIGDDWGAERHTEESLREMYRAFPDAGVGIQLGPDTGIIDIEVEDRATGPDTLLDLFDGEVIETMGWDSHRGAHALFRWDDRLLRYGKPILKTTTKISLPGLEIRLGCGGQFQSVCPPTPSLSGRVREWNGVETIAELPDCFYDKLDAIVKAAEPAPNALPLTNGHAHVNGDLSIEERARRYLAKLPEAIEHQRGHDRLYHAACVLVDDFMLSYQQALPLLREWNQVKAIPPETEKQVEHKLTDALKNCTPSGRLLNGTNGTATIKLHPAGEKNAEEWDPPILDRALPAQPFPVEVLPPGLAWFVEEAAQCLTCPPDFIAVAALTIAGAAIGRSLALRVKDSWIEAPALYSAFVAPPGATKSPALALVSRPLWSLTEDLLAAHRGELERVRDEQKRTAALRKAQQAAGVAVADVREQLPPLRRIAVGDSTCEALAPILQDNPRGIIMVRDELTAWVTGLNQYKSGGKGSDRQFFLSAWSGSSVTVDRKSQHERGPLHIPHPFLAVIGAMTPEMLAELADAKNRDDGFIDRLLFAFPEPVQVRWNAGVIPPEATEGWERAVRDLWQRPMLFDRKGRPSPTFIRFSAGALETYATWFDAHCTETESIDFPRHIEGAWSKMRAYCARLALILDQLRRAYDPTSVDDPLDVSAEAVRGAVRLVDYFKDHCRRIRDLMRGVGDENPDARSVITWIRAGQRQQFSEREVKRNFPKKFGKDEKTLALTVEWLTKRCCIRPAPLVKKAVGRGPSMNYEVNPALVDGIGWD